MKKRSLFIMAIVVLLVFSSFAYAGSQDDLVSNFFKTAPSAFYAFEYTTEPLISTKDVDGNEQLVATVRFTNKVTAEMTLTSDGTLKCYTITTDDLEDDSIETLSDAFYGCYILSTGSKNSDECGDLLLSLLKKRESVAESMETSEINYLDCKFTLLLAKSEYFNSMIVSIFPAV